MALLDRADQWRTLPKGGFGFPIPREFDFGAFNIEAVDAAKGNEYKAQ